MVLAGDGRIAMSTKPAWNAEPKKFMAVEHLSQERALHPELLKLIEGCPGDRLLDYGCGDGRILARLSDRWHVDAYDPSDEMRALARQRVGSRLSRLVGDVSEITGTYDVVLLGMVILVLPTPEAVRTVLRDCVERMDAGSRLFITTTHPCFRTFDFSNVSTSFGRGQPFDYLCDGTPFEVTLRDPGTDPVVFTDYHWSLSFTVNMLNSEHLSVATMVEVPDDPESSNRNPFVPPYLILECRRSL